MSILINIDECINNYLCGEVNNPLLKKVIEEEIIYSNNLEEILKKYFNDVVESANFNDKLNNLSNLIKNTSVDTRNSLKQVMCNTFIELSSDQHIFLITSINDNIKNIFELLADDPSIVQILKYIISGLAVSLDKEDYVIKCIDACKLINRNLSNQVIIEYINNNKVELVTNDKLLTYFIEYVTNLKDMSENLYYYKLKELMAIKVESIKSDILDKLKLTDMNFAFEIYKLGKIIIGSKVKYQEFNVKISGLTDEQLEYIVKAIHTCIIKKNISQAQTILAIVFYLTNDKLSKFIEYYNKSLLLRGNNPDVLSIEYELWNINDQYDKIINNGLFVSYNQIINNIKYSNIINNDLAKIKIKNSNVRMNDVNVKLVNNNENSEYDSIKHHPQIQEYIDGLNKYFTVRLSLQSIQHDMDKSKIKIRTPMGSINCSLVFGSILLHLNDNDRTIKELSDMLNMKEDDVTKRINSLINYNIVIKLNDAYKYVPAYGDIDCELINDITEHPVSIVIDRFTDILMTIESRIVKEVKPNKMNKMELERRIQEFLGESFLRNIFYDRLESLKKRYYVKEVDSIIEYVV